MRYILQDSEKDDTTGLDHTWWRKYENTSGRWTSPDPVNGSPRNPQAINKYAYVANDAVNFLDPTGLLMNCAYVTGYESLGSANPRVEWNCWFLPDDWYNGPKDGDVGPNTREIKKDFYDKYGKIFNDCLQEVFGKDSPVKRTLDNAPRLNTIETAATLKIRSRAYTTSTVVGTIIPPQKR